MFKNLSSDGSRNECRHRVLKEITKRGMSQNDLADALQDVGLDLNKNAINNIINGKRFVTDIEIKAIAKYFGITTDELLSDCDIQ